MSGTNDNIPSSGSEVHNEFSNPRWVLPVPDRHTPSRLVGLHYHDLRASMAGVSRKFPSGFLCASVSHTAFLASLDEHIIVLSGMRPLSQNM